jgi:hypothetical protein
MVASPPQPQNVQVRDKTKMNMKNFLSILKNLNFKEKRRYTPKSASPQVKIS